MIKTRIVIASLLLLCTLVTISAPQLFYITTVKASPLNASVIFGSPDDGLISTAESQATTSGCEAIAYYFSIDNNYNYLENYCGSNTNYNTVYSVNNYFNTYPYNYATDFYKGDSCYAPPGQSPNTHSHNMYWLYSDSAQPTYPNLDIWDEMIGQYTTNGINHFTFLWSCMLADELGGISGSDIWGMAPAWLHTTNLKTVNAYNSPDSSGKCFISFEGYSMPWSDYTGYSSYTYQIFGSMFYYFAAVEHYSIHDALNMASEYYIGVPFNSANDPLYEGYTSPYQGQMMIFGDPSVTLP